MSDVIGTFIIFFAVIDPIGTVPVFIAVTRDYDETTKRKVAVLATVVSVVVLLLFVIVGEVVLTSMDIPLSAFQIAGGIVLFLFALSMIFGESKPEEEMRWVKEHDDTAIYPLAIPSIAGPGAMLAAVMRTENSRFNLMEQIQTAGVIVVVLLIVLALMLMASRVQRLIGDAGASVISRVMGLILTATAVTSVLSGVKAYFNL